jgi:hypothetical protein
MDAREAEARLADRLSAAYSGELAAALVYAHHARSVRDASERAHIERIRGEELHHREGVGRMLAALGGAPSAARERRARAIGATLGPLCHATGWLAPMLGAGFLERGNIVEYEVAARLAARCGRAGFVAPLLDMAEVEWDHERWFRGRVLDHPLGRRLPLWSVPPPRGEIRASFEREFPGVAGPTTVRAEPAPAVVAGA